MSELVKCKACGHEVAKGAKACPNCGKDPRNFFIRHKFLTAFLVLVSMGALTQAFYGTDSTPSVDTNTANYELVSTRPGLNNVYYTFYLTVPKTDAESLISIVKAFKNEYPQSRVRGGFAIEFFNESDKNAAEQWDCTNVVASYYINYNNGASELYITATDQTIDIN